MALRKACHDARIHATMSPPGADARAVFDAVEQARVEAEVSRQSMATEGYARDVRLRAQGEADAARAKNEAEGEAEARRVAMWRDVPPEVLLGLALQAVAEKLEHINHLNVTPDLIGDGLAKLLRRNGER